MINRPQLAQPESASPTETARELAARVPAPIEQLLFEVKRLIVGQDRLLERLLIALLAEGHVLLEAMQERQVTIGKETHQAPDPFVVLATENPIETDGTYPLPEAQLDRFMLKVLVDYPSFQEEVVVVERITGPEIELHQVVTLD